jgi:hypothetical protein
MTDKITLTTFGSLQNDTSATSDLNSNFSTIVSAIDNTLSRDGTSPNQMGANLDMNSNRILNLPLPVNSAEPLRLQDAALLNGGGTITSEPLPIGGTTGQVLAKNSNNNYDVGWTNVVSGVNVTSGKTLSATNTLTLSGTDNTVFTFPPVTGNVLTDASNNALTNKSFNTAGTGNAFQINGQSITGLTGTGNSVVLATSPSISSPTITSSFTATNLVGNTALAQSPAVTLKGNPTNATANVSDFTINSLTTSNSPDAANDYLVIWDHTAGTLKKVNPVTIAGSNTAGVSSLGGQVGTLSLGAGLTNSSTTILTDASYMRGYISGCTLSNDSGTPNTIIDISAGVVCSDDQSTLIKSAAITKTTGSWTVGSGSGGLDTGSVAASTWYHVYIIQRLDTLVVDALISTSATTPTMPTNYTVKRRIGSFQTNASVNIKAFAQNGDEFLWLVPTTDWTTQITTAASLATLSVPLGVKVNALIVGQITSAGGPLAAYFSSPDVTSTAVSATVQNLAQQSAAAVVVIPNLNVRTNTSSQIRVIGTGTMNSSFGASGWLDTRGKYL